MGLHDGHRANMRKRYLASSLSAFADHEVLEMLLYYPLPRRDTNEIAHQLLREFGSLHGVFTAPLEALAKVEGMGGATALYLHLLNDSYHRLRIQEEDDPTIFSNVDAMAAFFEKRFHHLRQEVMYMACLDAKGKLLKCVTLTDGTSHSAEVSTRRIVEQSLYSQATAVVLAHNHPSGVALPSKDDITATRQAETALRLVDVTLLDHLIFADGEFVSLRESGSLTY